MKRNRLKIKFWLTMAFAATSLAIASSASAMLPAADIGGSAVAPTAPVAVNPSRFNWADAAIGAAVALTIVVAALAAAYIARNRSRLVASH